MTALAELLPAAALLAAAATQARWLLRGRRPAPDAGQSGGGSETLERLRGIFDASPDALLLCDGDGVVVDVNESACKLFAVPRAQIVDSRIDGLLGNGTDSTGQGAPPTGGTRELLLADGSRRWIEVRRRRLGDGSDVVSIRDASDREELESRARAGRSRWSAIVDELPAFLWTCDRHLRVTSVRGKAADAIGLREEEVLGRRIVEVVGEAGERDVVQFHGRALAGETAGFRVRFRGRAFEGAIAAVADGERTTELVGIALDVTDRDDAQRRARHTDRRLHDVLDHAPIMVLIKDIDLRIVEANPQMALVTGIPRESLVGRRATEVLPAELADTVERNDRSALDEGRARTFLEGLGDEDGGRWFAAVKFPLQRPDGTPFALCTMMREVSETMAMRARLRRHLLALDEAQALAQLGSFEWKIGEGRFSGSAHLYEMLGIAAQSSADTALRAFHDLLDADQAAAFAARVVEALFSPAVSFRFEMRIGTGAAQRCLLVQARVDRDATGTAIRVFGFVQDVTDRRREEELFAQLNASLEARVERRTTELEFAKKELRSFSYAVSHDLRQPLRAIAGYLALLEEDRGGALPPALRGDLDRIRQATRQMDATIDALLSLSRVKSAALHRTEVDASEMAREVAWEISAAEPGRKVDWQIEDGLRVRADAKLLRVLLLNLLGNAFKFTRRREHATIGFGREADGELFVRDDGAGFDAGGTRRLFEPFQRMHDQKEFEGTGIGLATVSQILERHGGTIRAESEPGRGATFRFRLPD